MDCFSDLRFYEDFVNNFESEGTTAVEILVPLSSLFESMTGKVENIGESFALKKSPKNKSFLCAALLIFSARGQTILCGGGCAVRCRMLRSNPGLYSLDAGSIPPKFEQPKVTPDIDKWSPCGEALF